MSWSMVQSYSVVMLGGALGSALRFLMASTITARWGDAFPWGTFFVNASGCFAIGFYDGWTGPAASPLGRQFVTIGILGGYTTFSSFGLQTYNLLTHDHWVYAALNAFGSLVVCLLAVWIGIALATLVHPR